MQAAHVQVQGISPMTFQQGLQKLDKEEQRH